MPYQHYFCVMLSHSYVGTTVWERMNCSFAVCVSITIMLSVSVFYCNYNYLGDNAFFNSHSNYYEFKCFAIS